MRSIVILSIVVSTLLVVLSCMSGVTHSASATNKKVEELKNIAISNNGFIPFNMDLVRKYVYNQGRQYHLILYLTSTSPKHGCDVCVVLKNEIGQFSQNSYLPYLQSDDFERTPIFIGVMEVDQTMEIFQKLKFETIPHLIHHPPGDAEISRKANFGRMETFSPEKLVDFIQKSTGVRIELVKTFFEKHGNAIAFVSVILLAIRIIVFFNSRKSSPYFWLTICYLVVGAVLAGVFFIFIHHPPMFEYNHQTKQFSYFARGARQQTISEGIIIGSLSLFTSIAFIVLADIIPNKFSTLSKPKHTIVFFFAFIAFLAGVMSLSRAFSFKYGRGLFMVPDEIKNPSMIFSSVSQH